MTYDPDPRHPVVGGTVESGYDVLARRIAIERPAVLAVDGPWALAWDEFAAALRSALAAQGLAAEAVDMRRHFVPWAEVEQRTASSALPGDPVFARIFDGPLEALLEAVPKATAEHSDVCLVLGPGSGLCPHDVLWYADRPKRMALAAVQAGAAGNVGQPPDAKGTKQRLLFVDWPMLDRHKQALAPRIDLYVDLSNVAAPRCLDGDALRRSLRTLAERPFRTRPFFLPGPWGGQWLRDKLGVATDAPNLAWSYELIAPEAGVLLGDDDLLEVGFELLVAQEPERLLGGEPAERFGLSFPLRFDYLDTLGGGNLSIQCHPSEEYMRERFGWPYTQHETYYVMATTPGAKIFLGLREDADLEAFRRDAERAERPGIAFDPERYLQTRQAERHRLYLIPAGTPHASGAGNVVLEISATPYLYTLRFFDWLRRNLDGTLRPVHVEHAFSNLDASRRGTAVRRELVQEPTSLREGAGWAELVLGTLPELFFAVHRLDFDDAVSDDTAGRFHLLNLVDGEAVEIGTANGSYPLAYAETVVIPAAVGAYTIRRRTGPACKVVKAFVR